MTKTDHLEFIKRNLNVIWWHDFVTMIIEPLFYIIMTSTSSAGTNRIQQIARIVLGMFLTFAGIGHLTWARREFLAQVPTWLPMNGDFVVVASGVVEVLLGLSLIFLVRYQRRIGLIAAIFFVLVFPGNISQYVNKIDAFGLNTDSRRLIRLFFQPVLIIWALWSTRGSKKL